MIALFPLMQSVALAVLSIFVYLPVSLWIAVKSILLPSKKQQYKFILITGATSGIGKSLAERYARKGVTLALTGRNAKALEETSDICKNKGAVVFTLQSDVTDREALKAWIDDIDASGGGIDLVVANAGITENTANVAGDVEKSARVLFDVNVVGVFNTIFPCIEHFKVRQKGQVVIVSSLAGLGPLSGLAAYSATKSAVRVYGESLRWQLYRDNIGVTVVCPGFVDSPMTQRPGTMSMPGKVSMEYCIDKMVDGIAKNEGCIAFPKSTFLMSWINGNMPYLIKDWIAHKRLIPVTSYFPKRKAGKKTK
jgi:short-subunit dehydrogenase